jgi:hypothetical protein
MFPNGCGILQENAHFGNPNFKINRNYLKIRSYRFSIDINTLRARSNRRSIFGCLMAISTK